MINLSNIKSLTEFLRNAKDHVMELRKTGLPEVLTVNGEAAIVVQDAKSYEKMAILAKQAEDDERLRKALESFRHGHQGVELSDAFAEIRAKRS